MNGSSWSGDISGTENPMELTVDSELNITANFTTIPKPKTFGGSEDDIGNSIYPTSDGGFIVTGSFFSNDSDFSGLNNGYYDIVVLKFDSNSNKEWTKTFGGSGFDRGNSIIQTSDGGYLITGSKGSNDGDFSGLDEYGFNDIFVIKLNSMGEKKWVKIFGGSEDDEGSSIVETEFGDYILTGTTDSNDGNFEGLNSGSSDIVVMKLDSNGEKNWVELFGEGEYEVGKEIIETTDGNYIVTGFSETRGEPISDVSSILTMKIDRFSETQKWIKTFGTSISYPTNVEKSYSLVKTSTGGCVITGSTKLDEGDFDGMNKGRYDIFAVELDTDGNVQWVNSLGGFLGEGGHSIFRTANEDYVITGSFTSNDADFDGFNPSFAGDIFVMRLNSNGNLEWVKRVGGSSRDLGQSIVQLSNGDFVLTGESSSNDGDFDGVNKGNLDLVIFKLSSN